MSEMSERNKNEEPTIWNRVKARYNSPNAARENMETFFFGQEDNICDYVPNTHPGFEKALERAKMIDRVFLPLAPLRFLSKEPVKRMLQKEFGEKQPRENCEGLRTIP